MVFIVNPLSLFMLFCQSVCRNVSDRLKYRKRPNLFECEAHEQEMLVKKMN